jgi:gas vesicle protein
MNNTGKILTAIAAGAALGAIAGILFAPDKGTEIRRKITEQGKEIATDVKEKFLKGREKFNDLKNDIRHTVKENVEEFS